MILTICLSIVGTTAFYALLLFIAFHRLASHLQGNAEATTSLVNHCLLPVLGKKKIVPAPEVVTNPS